MAKKLEAFPETVRVSAAAKYPWDEWLDGSIYELTKGEDFDIKIESFRTSAQLAAKNRRGKVRSARTDNGDGLIIQFVPNPTGVGNGPIRATAVRADRG